MTMSVQKEFTFLLRTHIEKIYTETDSTKLVDNLVRIMRLEQCSVKPEAHTNNWSEQDVWLITYGDSIEGNSIEGNSIEGNGSESARPESNDANQSNLKDENAQVKTKYPLHFLEKFLSEELEGVINGVHILPFFPYSSDDGFSVIDYSQVNDGLGDWSHIESIAAKFRVMADLVINHCSSRSRWFENFKQRKHPGKDFFIEVALDSDLSKVVRPRTSPLLREVETLDGKKSVWCTFSHDQVDLDFSNTQVLCEFVGILRLYLDRGIRIFRFDAVAFLWKEMGTPCIHHPKTHEIVRLLRTLIEHACPDAIVITETNVPNHENLSYFGNANEAHAVYNFSLPPLVLHALVTGTCEHLKAWQMSMPPAQMGTFYFNFIASHDGIGLRPVEGLLSEQEIDGLVNTMQQFGARISWRALENGKNKPYEINITLYDAMQGTSDGPDRWQLERFICAHAIMFALEGMPALYIHSLLGTNNYYEGVELTNHNRTINRYKWNYFDIKQKLADSGTHHHKVFEKLKKLLNIRSRQNAFHPNAVQFTLHLGNEIFGFWRQSAMRDQSIFCLHNVTDKEVIIPLSSINLISLDSWHDLVSGDEYSDITRDIVLKPYHFVWLTNKISN